MPGLIGKKLGMTSVFDENREMIACTIIEAGPCYVTQIKTDEVRDNGKRDGYNSVQIGFDRRKEKRTPGPLKGHFKKAGVDPLKVVMESDMNPSDYQLGDKITVGKLFQAGDFVDVVGKSKGKGFQGVVKRHGFRGVGGQTHGQHNRGRAPGAIGACSFPSRVFKGMRMGGRMGNQRVKIQNLKVMKVLDDKNILLVSGAVPGPKGGYLYVEI